MAYSDKREAAEALFHQGWEQVDIATTLKVAKNTISNWAIEGKWRERRANKNLTRQNSEDAILELIEYQTYVLKRFGRKMRELLEAKGEDASLDDLKGALLQNGQLDGLQKLFTTLKGKELGWDDHVTVCTSLVEFLNNRGLNMAEINLHVGDYLISKKG